MDAGTLSVWAIVVATLSTFVIGFLWYGPLFGSTWMEAAGVSEEDVEDVNKMGLFGTAFVMQFIMAVNLAFFLNDPSIGLQQGALYGFLVGFGWVFLALAVNSLYEQRSWRYIFVNGGYWTVAFTVMGLILGAW